MSMEPNLLLKLTHPQYLYAGVDTFSFSVLAGAGSQLVLCFLLLGICASDHLCPNVAYLTKSGNSSKGIIASILLAWCNSAPDLFSNLISWVNSDSAATLSLGEVLGSCGIIICIIQGLLLYCMKERLDLSMAQRNSLVTDLLFALLAMVCVLWIVIANSVTWYISSVMVMIYATYVASKIRLHSSIQDLEETTPGTVTLNADKGDNKFSFMEGSIRPSLLETLDFNIVIQMLENANNAETISMNTMTQQVSDTTTVADRPITEPSQRSKLMFENDHERAPVSTAPTKTDFKPFYDNVEVVTETVETSDTLTEPPLTYEDSIAHSSQRKWNSIFYLLFPNLKNWKAKTLQSKVLSTVLSPLVLLLRVAIPQYSDEAKFNMTLLILQAIFSPIMSMFVIESLIETHISAWFWFIPGTISFAFIAGIMFLRYKGELFLGVSLYSHTAHHNRMNQIVVSFADYIGIINSILCISLLANILIEIIELFQKMTGLSKSLLGITLFAWGNSISDLMSNLAMSQLYQKLPSKDSQKSVIATRFLSISLSACIGGALLNMTIGIGLSSLVAMIFRFHASSVVVADTLNFQFLISAVIICIAILTAISGLTRFQDTIQQNTKVVGLILCSTWLFATVLNLCIEIIQ